MMSRFSSFVLALLLLVASGQVAAINYYSKVSAPSLTSTDLGTLVTGDWSEVPCAGTMASASTAFGAVADSNTFTLCGTGSLAVAGASIGTVALPAHIKSITIAPGATLTVTGAVTSAGTTTAIVNNGILTITGGSVALGSGATGTYTGTGVLNSACTAAASTAWTTAGTWGTATSGCGVTVGTGAVPPSPSAGSDVTIGTFAVTAGTGTVKSLTLNGTTGGLALSGALTTTGAVTMSSATALNMGANALNVGTNLGIGGTAAITGTGVITLGGGLTTAAVGSILSSPALTLTYAAHALAVTGGLALGAVTLTPPVSGTADVAITVSVGTITATSFSVGVCDTTASATVGTVNTPTTTAATAIYYCTVNAVVPGVAAPIFSTKEKAAVFSQEVK